MKRSMQYPMKHPMHARVRVGGGKEGVVSLVWHPIKHPMQLLAVGTSGAVYIWAKVKLLHCL
jgi:hypothetical protein